MPLSDNTTNELLDFRQLGENSPLKPKYKCVEPRSVETK